MKCPTDAFVEALRDILEAEAAFMTFLGDRCVLRQPCKKSGEREPNSTAPGFCFWTLVPEQPQALVIEDMRLDARYVLSFTVTLRNSLLHAQGLQLSQG